MATIKPILGSLVCGIVLVGLSSCDDRPQIGNADVDEVFKLSLAEARKTRENYCLVSKLRDYDILAPTGSDWEHFPKQGFQSRRLLSPELSEIPKRLSGPWQMVAHKSDCKNVVAVTHPAFFQIERQGKRQTAATLEMLEVDAPDLERVYTILFYRVGRKWRYDGSGFERLGLP